jgi:two-component system chemotaxis response regulator CheY
MPLQQKSEKPISLFRKRIMQGFFTMSQTVLIVDEIQTVRNLAKYALAKSGCHIIEADNGQCALEIARNETVDLIIFSFEMKTFGGFELAQALKLHPKTKNIPVIILTTETSPQYANHARDLGISAWMIKPFLPDKLLGAVRKILRTSNLHQTF